MTLSSIYPLLNQKINLKVSWYKSITLLFFSNEYLELVAMRILECVNKIIFIQLSLLQTENVNKCLGLKKFLHARLH